MSLSQVVLNTLSNFDMQASAERDHYDSYEILDADGETLFWITERMPADDLISMLRYAQKEHSRGIDVGRAEAKRAMRKAIGLEQA